MVPATVILLLYILPGSIGFQCESDRQSKEADPMSCRKYYSCMNKKATSQNCADTDTFDVFFKRCRATEVVETCSYAPTDCYIDRGYGFDYQGSVSVTEKGESCIAWDKSIYSFDRYRLAENYCRNPNPDQYDRPWCSVDNAEEPAQYCDVPQCKGSSVSFNGRGTVKFTTGTGTSNITYDLEASYEEQIMFYLRPTTTESPATIFKLASQSDDQGYYVKVYQKVLTVYGWLENGKVAKTNTWVNLADNKAHKVVIKRHGAKLFLKVDDGPDNYGNIPGMTDKLMLPMTVEIGESYQGCISSFDIVTTNAEGKYRHHEPFAVLTGQSEDKQMVLSTPGNFSKGYTSGCMLTPRFSETMAVVVPTPAPTPTLPPNNGTEAEIISGESKDLYIILGAVVGAALLILIIVLIIVCRTRNKDKGVYKIRETNQFDWEYGNIPPSNKSLMKESEHGV